MAIRRPPPRVPQLLPVCLSVCLKFMQPPPGHLRYSHGFASRAVSAFDDDDDEYFVRFHNAARSDSRQSVLRLLDYYETPRAGDGDVAADGKVYYLAGALTD